MGDKRLSIYESKNQMGNKNWKPWPWPWVIARSGSKGQPRTGIHQNVEQVGKNNGINQRLRSHIMYNGTRDKKEVGCLEKEDGADTHR